VPLGLRRRPNSDEAEKILVVRKVEGPAHCLGRDLAAGHGCRAIAEEIGSQDHIAQGGPCQCTLLNLRNLIILLQARYQSQKNRG
jgi:hypothetical protein